LLSNTTTPLPTSKPGTTTPTGPAIGPIIGGVIGGLAALAALFAAFIWYRRRSASSQSSNLAAYKGDSVESGSMRRNNNNNTLGRGGDNQGFQLLRTSNDSAPGPISPVGMYQQQQQQQMNMMPQSPQQYQFQQQQQSQYPPNFQQQYQTASQQPQQQQPQLKPLQNPLIAALKTSENPRDSTTSTSTSTTSASESFQLRKIVHPYTPTLADELELVMGKDILVLKEFDDGWGLAMDPESGVQGAFPLVCVAPASAMDPRMSIATVNSNAATGNPMAPSETAASSGDVAGRRFSKRVSSMIVPSVVGGGGDAMEMALGLKKVTFGSEEVREYRDSVMTTGTEVSGVSSGSGMMR
jgi:hypothetical protein